MKQQMKDEATNPSNIGNYKCSSPSYNYIPRYTTPSKGSYHSIISSECKNYLESWGIDENTYVDLVYTAVLERNNPDILNLIDNDYMNPSELDKNAYIVEEFVRLKLVPQIIYCSKENSINPSNIYQLLSDNTVSDNLAELYESISKQELKEGFFSDLVDLARVSSDDSENKTQSTNSLDKLLSPYKSSDIYSSVIRYLQTFNGDDTVYNKIVPQFFPEDGRAKIPKSIDKSAYNKYKNKLEDAIIEYCYDDGEDIISRVQKSFQDKGKQISEITGSQYIGTIQNRIYSDDYDLIDKLKSIYSEYENAIKESQSSENFKISSVESVVSEFRNKFSSISNDQFADAFNKMLKDKFSQDLLTEILNGSWEDKYGTSSK